MGELGNVGREEEGVGSERRLPVYPESRRRLQQERPDCHWRRRCRGEPSNWDPHRRREAKPHHQRDGDHRFGQSVSPELTFLQLPPSLANPTLTFPVPSFHRTSIELNHKAIPIVRRGQPSVAVKIEGPNQPLYGRQLEEKDVLYSLISRVTIDTLKNHFREEVTDPDWRLILTLKKIFNIS